MSTRLQAVEAEAMKLSPSERAELAERLIASMDLPVSLDVDWEAPPPADGSLQASAPR